MEEKKKTPLIENIASEIEELEVQLKLGKMDLTDSIGKRKKEFADLIRRVRDFSLDVEKESEEKLEQIKKESDDLLDILDADWNIAYHDFEDESGHVREKLEKLEKKAVDLYGKVEQKAEAEGEKVKEEFMVGFEKFRNEIKLQQKKVEHKTEDAVAEFNTWKEDRLKDIEKLKAMVEEKTSEAESKKERFNKEIAEAYSHFKKAFGF